MATWLHDPATLDSLADGPPGVARDWANLRLALRTPDRMRHLPTRQWDLMLALAVGARGAVDGVLELVRSGGNHAVDALDSVLALGLLPEEPGPWVEAVTALFPTVAERDRATVARALADLGALDGTVLSTAARGDMPDVRTLVPGLVLRWAASQGMALGPVAAELAGPLARAEVEEPGVLGWAMTVLGLPHVDAPEDPDAAVLAGARLAGAGGGVARQKGSARSRARRWVTELLDGRTGPAEELLRALVAHEGPDPGELCALAAWCASRPDPTHPMRAVCGGAAGEDRAVLALARREMSADWSTALMGPLTDEALRSTPVVGLGTPFVIGTELGLLRDALLVRAELSREIDASVDLGTFVVAASDPERVVAWLVEPATRDLGLSCARVAPTVEVLGALLGLHVPLDPGAREIYGWALAEMADPAALAALEAAEGVPAEVVVYGRELLGR